MTAGMFDIWRPDAIDRPVVVLAIASGGPLHGRMAPDIPPAPRPVDRSAVRPGQPGHRAGAGVAPEV